METADDLKWFAMGAPYRNELKVQIALAERGVDCFVPMVTHVIEKNGRKVRKTEPAVSNLLFVHSTDKRLREAKSYIPRLQYKVFTEDGEVRKVVVRDEEMENFIKFLKCSNEGNMKFVGPGEFNLKAGTKVKVVGGQFDGVCGTLLRSASRKSKTLVVELEGLISASVEILPELVEIIS